MKFFLDSSVLFDAIEDNANGTRIKTLLHHVKNDNHALGTSLTVYGEIVQVCIRDNRDDDLQSILDLIAELNLTCSLPSLLLRDCCKCMDRLDKDRRVGLSDKTHLAYFMAYNDDYFVTSDKNLRSFPLDKKNCKRCGGRKDNSGRVISLAQLRKLL